MFFDRKNMCGEKNVKNVLDIKKYREIRLFKESVFLCGKVEKIVDNLLFHFFRLFHIEKSPNFHISEKYVKTGNKLR